MEYKRENLPTRISMAYKRENTNTNFDGIPKRKLTNTNFDVIQKRKTYPNEFQSLIQKRKLTNTNFDGIPKRKLTNTNFNRIYKRENLPTRISIPYTKEKTYQHEFQSHNNTKEKTYQRSSSERSTRPVCHLHPRLHRGTIRCSRHPLRPEWTRPRQRRECESGRSRPIHRQRVGTQSYRRWQRLCHRL